MAGFSPRELVKRAAARYSVARGVLAHRRRVGHADGVVTHAEARSIHDAEREVKLALDLLEKRKAAAAPKGVSDRGLALIAGFEGFRARPYRDSVGVWTIGYGETKGVGAGTAPWTRAHALVRLRVRANRDYLAPVVAVARSVGLTLKPYEKDALTSLVYNTGPGILARGKAMGDALRSRSRTRIAGAFLVYDNANPGDGILRPRRERERHVFLHGYGA